MRRPYYVCGGLQDNGSWCGPSRTTHGGILKDDWFRVSGGDGFYAIPVPGKPHLIYSDLQGGVFMITDMRSGATRRIHPYPNRIGSAGDAMLGHKYRFNWDSPIHISPHDPGVVYIGGNVVFKSTDYGHSWQEISPDLTTRDTTKQLSSGGEIYQDNTAAEFHTTILTIAESPVERGVIWAGTDDGRVWVTRDGGAGWSEITRNIRGMPEFAWVAKIDASHFDAGTAYIAVDQHRMDDFTPHVYRVSEFGERSEDLSGGLPQDDYVKVVREDTRNPDILYVGMERGIFASWDRGENWISIRNGLPPVSVRDIQVHPRDNDLIIGTHGRGAYILDDIRPLQQLGAALKSDVFLFEPRGAVRWETGNRDASMGQRTYRAPNPPYGALVSYYLSEKPEGDVMIVATDAQGDTVRKITARDPGAGVNRTVWDLRYAGPEPVPGEEEEARGFFAGAGGPLVVPGEYTLTLHAGAEPISTTVTVEADPRVGIPDDHYIAQRDVALALRDMISRVNRAIGTANSLGRQINDLIEAIDAGEVEHQEELRTVCDSALDEIDAWLDKALRPPPRMNYRQRPRLREELFSLMRSVTGAASRPTEGEIMRLRELEEESNELMVELNHLLDERIAEINRLAGAEPRIIVRRPVP